MNTCVCPNPNFSQILRWMQKTVCILRFLDDSNVYLDITAWMSVAPMS